jgi:hypothetical protein
MEMTGCSEWKVQKVFKSMSPEEQETCKKEANKRGGKKTSAGLIKRYSDPEVRKKSFANRKTVWEVLSPEELEDMNKRKAKSLSKTKLGPNYSNWGEKYQELAAAKGGKYLGDPDAGSHSKQPWICASGHDFMMNPNTVMGGHWCGKCWRARRGDFTDPVLRSLAQKMRTRIRTAIKQKMLSKREGSAIRDLGCTLAEFKTYIEALFQPGMTWDNWTRYGWHLDHIKPLCSFDFTKREEFLKAVHYTNLQPLWAEDNMKKGGRCVPQVNSMPPQSNKHSPNPT